MIRTVFLVLGLVGASLAGSFQLHRSQIGLPPTRARAFMPPVTIVLMALVALPSALQFAFPALLPLLQRDRGLFIAGEWWRGVTPLIVQDGGFAGAIFNVVSLCVVASLAESIGGGRYLLVLFVLGGVISEAIAFSWQPVGAGNSIANFSIAAGVLAWCLVYCRGWAIVGVVLPTLALYLALLVMHDIHGAAALIGFVLGLTLIWLDRRSVLSVR